MAKTKYKRVLLKLSGEAFSGKEGHGIDSSVLTSIATQIKHVREMGVEIAVVVGGGNFWRGAQAEHEGMDRVTADYAGMLATIINAIALQDRLEKEGVETRTQTAIEIKQIAEPYIRRQAIHHLEEGRVVIFGAGTGNPYFTTDSAAALRALEIKADIILKATKVDGVYSADPMSDASAKLYGSITYQQVLERQLRVMDASAISLCMDNMLPIIVFNMRQPGNIQRVVTGEKGVGTVVGF